jgi:hypothetical protein
VIVCSGCEIGMSSGRAVCCRKMELSWSSWWRCHSVIGDNCEEGEVIIVLGRDHVLQRWRRRWTSDAA